MIWMEMVSSHERKCSILSTPSTAWWYVPSSPCPCQTYALYMCSSNVCDKCLLCRVMQGSMVKLPEDEDTPDKRVTKIFAMMDKVYYHTHLATTTTTDRVRFASSNTCLVERGWQAHPGGVSAGFQERPFHRASALALRWPCLASIIRSAC